MMDEEQLCHRLHKRLRIGSPTGRSRHGGYGSRDYTQANYLLQQLHVEQQSRKNLTGCATAASAHPMELAQPQMAWTASGAAVQSDFGAMTHFALSDVVQCPHGPNGRCLQCTGRLVQNVPLQVYSDWCAAFSSPASSSTAPPPRPLLGSGSTRELTFPALASLTACLAPEPGDRLLHLCSGVARVAAAWALLVPRGVACGVELCPALHNSAAAAVLRLEHEVQQRIFLHCGGLLDMQGEWHQASIILLSADGLSDACLAQVTPALMRVGPGARVVSLGRPLALGPGGGDRSLQLVRQAVYRTVSSGNLPVFIYRKPGA